MKSAAKKRKWEDATVVPKPQLPNELTKKRPIYTVPRPLVFKYNFVLEPPTPPLNKIV